MRKPRSPDKYLGQWVRFQHAGMDEVFKAASWHKERAPWNACGYTIWLRPVPGTSTDKDCSGYDVTACTILTEAEVVLLNL